MDWTFEVLLAIYFDESRSHFWRFGELSPIIVRNQNLKFLLCTNWKCSVHESPRRVAGISDPLHVFPNLLVPNKTFVHRSIQEELLKVVLQCTCTGISVIKRCGIPQTQSIHLSLVLWTSHIFDFPCTSSWHPMSHLEELQGSLIHYMYFQIYWCQIKHSFIGPSKNLVLVRIYIHIFFVHAAENFMLITWC
jgi:hypothetical protein